MIRGPSPVVNCRPWASRLFIRGPVAFALLAAVTEAASAQGASPARRIRESVSLDTDSSVVKKLRLVDDYLAEQKWAAALDILGQISTTHGESLIAATPGWYVNVAHYCNLVLSRMPPEALTVYRERTDAQAKQWFETAVAERDDALLQRVVRQAFAGSYGDDALFLLGEWAWERGDLADTRHFWEQLLPVPTDAAGRPFPVLRYPNAPQDRGAILARLILCSLMQNDRARAERELRIFRDLYPDAVGQVAGRSGNLAETLTAVLAEAKQWPARSVGFHPARAESIRPSGEPGVGGAAERQSGRLAAYPTVRTFAGNARRNHVVPQSVAVGAVAWSVSLPRNPFPAPDRRPALPDRGPLSFHPVVYGNLVLVNDSSRIFGYDLRTGKPYRWPSGAQPKDAVVYPPRAEEADGFLPLPIQPVVGVPMYTLTLDEGRLYAKMGTPITGQSRRDSELRNITSDIVCLDLARKEGGLVWKVSAAEIADGERGWAFEGSPIVAGGRGYVALRRSQPQTQVNVACFNAETGETLWNRKVCAAVSPVGGDFNSISHQLLTLAGDSLFYSTDLGAVAALDTRDGVLQWVVTYESRPPENQAELSDPLYQGLLPCLYHQGTVIAAPNDSGRLFALDAYTGILLWERARPRERVRHLLGVGIGRLIAAGHALWGLDVRPGDGQTVEETQWGYPQSEPAHYSYGRGLLVEDAVWQPTHDAIEIRSQRTGRRLDQPINLREKGETGGNLLIAGNRLLIAQPDRLVCFTETGRTKQPPEQPIAAFPQSSHHAPRTRPVYATIHP